MSLHSDIVTANDGSQSLSGGKMAKLLNVAEFAEAIGLSPKTIRQWVWMRRVPYVRVGRAIRFRPETVNEILDRGTIPALEPHR
jgi:excisionase family DNA binding protein